MKMRTINQAAKCLKDLDLSTAITKTALRRLVVTGELPCVRIGQKYLISLEVLDAFLENGTVQNHYSECNGIRKQGVRW